MEAVLRNAEHLQELLKQQGIHDGEEKAACDRLVEIFRQRLLPPVKPRDPRRSKKGIINVQEKADDIIATPITISADVIEASSISDKESVSRKSSRSKKSIINVQVKADDIIASPITVSTDVFEASSISDKESVSRKSSRSKRTSHRQSDFVYDTKLESKPKKEPLQCKDVLKNSDPNPLKIPKTSKKPQVAKKDNINDSNISFSSSVSKTAKNPNNRRNFKGETALHSACSSHKYSKVKEFLVAGVNPNTRDNAGWTPLHEMVSANSVDLVELLLEKGSFPDVPGPMNETPLHEAIRNNQVEIIKLLVRYGADVDVRNSKGVTPLDLADDQTKSIIGKEQKNQAAPKLYSIASVLPTSERSFSIKVYPHSLDNKLLMKLNLLSKHFTDLVIVDSLHKDVSLVVTNNSDEKCHPSFDILNAIVFGVPIISAEWINKSNEGELASWEDFEITDIGNKQNCIQLSYVNTFKMLPKLFNGCHFYFLDFNVSYEIDSRLTVNKKMLMKLATDGGGVVLKREPDPEGIPDSQTMIPFHARRDSVLLKCSHFIIYRKMPQLAYKMEHLKSLPVLWFIECIKNFQLIDPCLYV